MFNFKPDWVEIWTAAKAEEQLEGFIFNGPGWYCKPNIRTGDSWLLVLPVDRPKERIWDKSYDADEKFEFNVYNGYDPRKAFSLITNAPHILT